jgi:hypothetical protein
VFSSGQLSEGEDLHQGRSLREVEKPPLYLHHKIETYRCEEKVRCRS